MTSAACIADEELVAFADGALRPADAADVENHVAVCSECRMVLAELGREVSDIVPETTPRVEAG
jgi:anti-sigma factor RsiW